MNKSIFTETVKENVMHKKMSYMEAVLEACYKYNIEPEDCKRYITDVVKQKLEAEASNLNYLPRPNQLPLS